MVHFYENIQGWFNFSRLYSYIVQLYPSGSHFVEVGVWKGKSAAYMGVEIVNSGKEIRLDCIDPFIPVGDEMPEFKITHEELKNTFINNMKPLEGHYNLITTGSPKCTEMYQDKSIDFVFIDGDHSYDAVVKDINAWMPKVKKGGIISGHDYEIPSVKKACHDILGECTLKDPWGDGCWMLKVE